MMNLYSLIVVIIATFLVQTSCLPQTAPTAISTTTSASVFATSALPSPIMGIGCESGGGDARMDSFTVKRLSSLYCNKLLANFPRLTGENFSSAELPTDISPLPHNTNYTATEEQGFVAVFDLIIASSYIDQNATIHVQGSEKQCAADNCVRIFDAIVNRCEWNSHYIGGYHQLFTSCGFYSMYTLNCTNNIINPDCSRWHSKWQPSYTTTSTSATYSVRVYTNTDFYSFTVSDAATTYTSQVIVSTMTGEAGTSVTPLMYSFASTETGFMPNPTWDGPTLTPRLSSGTPTVTLTSVKKPVDDVMGIWNDGEA